MTHIVCYAAAVPTARKAEYEKHATLAAQVFKDHGARRVVECWGRDVPPGQVTSFPLAVQAGEDETVVIGWQEWADKATCDANMPKAMQDERLKTAGPPPMDGKRLIYASFDMMLEM